MGSEMSESKPGWLLTKRYGLAAYRDPSQWGNDLREEYPASCYGQLIELTRRTTSRPRALLLWWGWRLHRSFDAAADRGLIRWNR